MFEKYLDIVNVTPLFDGVNDEEIVDLLNCMNAYTRKFEKGSFIFLAGNAPDGIGIILKGKALIIKEDLFGNRSIMGDLKPGDIFGEVFACALVDELPVSVEAETDCEVLIMDYRKVITTCSASCTFHNMLIKNMLKILATKNLYLNNQNDILASRTTRDRIMKYLETVAEKSDNTTFEIPYDRQELADFLGINRSAMTRELTKMKDEGLIDFSRNNFTLNAM